MPTPALLAIDAPWLLYRSFFALPRSISDADGRPTGALLGSVNAILGAVEWCSPRAVVCCFGNEEAPYRVALYRGYHAHRDPMPKELRRQWELAGELFEAFGWTVAATDELEADDLLLSFARVEARAGGRTLLMTADRDLYQAVDEHTAVLALSRDGPPSLLGPDEVRQRYGIGPEQVTDFIALRGDPSDGLPGARGVGAKGAADLLAEYGSLEGILAATYRLRPRLGATLREQADELRRFREIATLVEVAVERPPDRETDRLGGAAAARAHGLERLAARLERSAAHPAQSQRTGVRRRAQG